MNAEQRLQAEKDLIQAIKLIKEEIAKNKARYESNKRDNRN